VSRGNALRALLVAHQPADAQERAHRDAMLALVEAGEAVLSRGHFEPGHFTASAFVLSPDRESVLLIHHSKLQRWLQPGGHIEPHDADVVAAALREVQEECGLSDLAPLGDGLFDVDVHVIPARRDEPAHKHFDVRVALWSRSEAATVGDGVSDVAWVPLAEVTASRSDASVVRAVGKLRALV